ncbi:MAG: hypothetical protein DMG54_33675 [Acidobacteria bacterium]|nr:MAG: hypothetical protein DMG54_33675 [Acidobacteriota bacterium]PYU68495.1 MAG: hypothetical protein DMG52_31390 [Acidobacteriota bacterium]
MDDVIVPRGCGSGIEKNRQLSFGRVWDRLPAIPLAEMPSTRFLIDLRFPLKELLALAGRQRDKF